MSTTPQIASYSMDVYGPSELMVTASTMQQGQSQAIQTNQVNGAELTNEDLRRSLKELVASHCCWGKKPVTDMSISEAIPMNSYHCKLETYMEKRSTSYEKRSYTDDDIDSPNNGPAPLPWSIPVSVPEMFTEKSVNIKMPHTERYADTVMAGGAYPAAAAILQESSCNGTGRCPCPRCRATGDECCNICKGTRRVVYYINLLVEFVNHVSDEVVDANGLQEDLIDSAPGFTMCQQTGYHLRPPQEIVYPKLQEACVKQFNEAERLMMNENSERLLQQRVTIRMVPVTKAVGCYKSTSFDFWVYGDDHRCYAPNYPAQCCCGCTLY